MFVIDKELLRPGVVYYPRSGPISFTESDLDDILRSSKALLASGRNPPIPWEHRDDAKPVKMSREDGLSELTRHNTGWVQDFFKKPDGSFWAKLGILDPDAEAKIKDGRVKYVSPEITPVLPADGKVHRNVVTHVAITHQPVWAQQTPFIVPPQWVGDDGTPVHRGARMSLLAGESIRLSQADAEPPEDVARALQFGYRIPGGKNAKGAWFKGVYYPAHIPQKVLKDADPDELRELLRKLNSRHGRRLPRDFAGLQERGESREYPTEVQSLPAVHLGLHDDLPPFHRPHRDGEPVLAWEDPEGGETHVVSGHDFLKKLSGQEGAQVPVLKVHGQTPYHARGAALMYHLLDGSAHHDDLAQLFMDGADPKELRAALQENGCSPHEPCFQKAEYLAGLRDKDPEAKEEPKQMSTSGPAEAAPAETLFSHAEGYDPEEHRWQHWLQSHFEDPAERAAFAAEHGKERPANHGDFLSRKDAFHKKRFSSGESPVDYFEMTKPKDEEKPKEKGEEKKGGDSPPEKKDGDGPPPKKDDAIPDSPKAAEHKFQSLLTKLEKFKVHLPPDKIKSAEDLVEQLETALHALEGAGAIEAAGDLPPPNKPEGGGKPPGQSLEAEQGSMFMSLKADNEALKKALLEKDAQVLSLEKVATTMVFSAVEKDTEALQTKGQCTKAQRDEWLGKIKGIAGQQRFSLLEPDKSVAMASVCAEIRMARSIPEGTFLPKPAAAPTPAPQDLHAMLFSNAPLPTNGNGTPKLQAEENKEAAVAPALPDGQAVSEENKAEFEETWKNIRMSLGIK